MAAAKFSEEVFAAITKGITEKVLSEIDNLRDRLEAVSSSPQAKRNDDLHARTVASVVADMLALKHLVEKLEIRMTAVETSNRAIRKGIFTNDGRKREEDQDIKPALDAATSDPTIKPEEVNLAKTQANPPSDTRANSRNHPSFKLRKNLYAIAEGRMAGEQQSLSDEIHNRLIKNEAPASLTKAVARAVDRLPKGFSGLGPSSRKLIGSPSFISITTMLTSYYARHNRESVDIEDFIAHVRSQGKQHGVGTVWSMLSVLTAIGVISASDRQYVSHKRGGPMITGNLVMDQRFVEDALAFSKQAAE